MCVFIGSSNTFVCGSELHNSLTSEIRFLRKQNQALNAVLARGSRGEHGRRHLQRGGRSLWRAGKKAGAGVRLTGVHALGPVTLGGSRDPLDLSILSGK